MREVIREDFLGEVVPELRLRGYGGGSAQRVEVSGGQGRRRRAQRGRNRAREREQVRSLRGGDPGTHHKLCPF